MAFDGAGKPYRSGPTWGCAILLLVGLALLAALALNGFLPILPD